MLNKHKYFIAQFIFERNRGYLTKVQIEEITNACDWENTWYSKDFVTLKKKEKSLSLKSFVSDGIATKIAAVEMKNNSAAQ